MENIGEEYILQDPDRLNGMLRWSGVPDRGHRKRLPTSTGPVASMLELYNTLVDCEAMEAYEDGIDPWDRAVMEKNGKTEADFDYDYFKYADWKRGERSKGTLQELDDGDIYELIESCGGRTEIMWDGQWRNFCREKDLPALRKLAEKRAFSHDE